MDQPRVKDIISTKFLTVSPEALVADVINQMYQSKASSAIIVEQGEIAGIITERDAVGLLTESFNGASWDNLPISHVMSSPVTSVGEDLILSDAITLAHDGQIRHVPVLNEDNHVIGVLNQSQIIRALVQLCQEHDVW